MIKILLIPLLITMTSCDYYKTDNIISKENNTIITNKDVNVNPYLLQVGNTTIQEALALYPYLKTPENSYTKYGSKKVLMPYAFYMKNPDVNQGGFIVLQFDDNQILQQIILFDSKYSFEETVLLLEKKYPPYFKYNLEEYNAVSNGEVSFENHQTYLNNHKDKIRLFKQGNMLVTVGKDSNTNQVSVFYINSNYFPILREKSLREENLIKD